MQHPPRVRVDGGPRGKIDACVRRPVEHRHEVGVRDAEAVEQKVVRFQMALRHAESQRDLVLPDEADSALLARVASALLPSIAVRVRGGDSRASLRVTAAAGVALICGDGPGAATRRQRSSARSGASR